MEQKFEKVKVWEELVVIPTYEVGAMEKNPLYLEKRVYQGSSGKVYPFPVIEKICDEKVDKTYRAVWLENEYLRIMLLPELGGRIQRAIDKTNGYDFVYYNEVIKPALVGLIGPWISGGIEFNWPQHHRPTTFSPVDYLLQENPDGSKTVHMNETDRMYGTKAIASFTLHPAKAYLEIKGQLYNPTNLPQTFLWWANPAVWANDHTQSIFPPDVHAVMDHGKRAVSRFPIATGEYYKYDYSAGVDISRYKNIPVPTSYMAYHSDYDFIGNYDYEREAGILHIADHHVSPGKKQWTWGCGDFGKAWDRNLTDENGPYIELMTGMFTDNQPDFSWLMPFEEKCFTQYFMPYKQVGQVKNACIDAILGLNVSDNAAEICIYGTSEYNATVVLSHGQQQLYTSSCSLSPSCPFEVKVALDAIAEHELTLTLYDADKKAIVSYTPAVPAIEQIPQPAQPAKPPEEIPTNEELYLTALHIEQYRHATYLPDPYYLEGLRRDPLDSRMNNAYGTLLLRRGLFAESEVYFRKAIERLTWKSPNPYNGEAHYNLGLSLLLQGKAQDAFDAFYKSTWNSAQQETGFYHLAALSAKEGKGSEALEFVQRALIKNQHNLKARGLKALLLKRLGMAEAAMHWMQESLQIDPFDYLTSFELHGFDHEPTLKLMRDNPETFMGVAACYGEYGCYDKALAILNKCKSETPLPAYHAAYYAHLKGDSAASSYWLKAAAEKKPDYCFPNKLMDIPVLQYAIAVNAEDAKARYYLANLWYDKLQYDTATKLWEESAQLNPKFPTVWRNLAFAYFNKAGEPKKACKALETAFSLDPTDARVFLELDQLYKKTGMPAQERIERYEQHPETFEKRDDLWIEYITLLNLLGRHQQAYQHIMSHKFHPWEGGEGRITSQYTLTLLALARNALLSQEAEKAISLLQQALVYPENLGEGKLEITKDNHVYYYLGLAYQLAGNLQAAKECWQKATLGDIEPAGMMYYNDQPADQIFYQGLAYQKLGEEQKARKCFHRLIDYGELHFYDTMHIDYFAVSLPDLQLFDEDLTMRHKAHCHYLIALGSLGLGNREQAEKELEKTLVIDCSHVGATFHLPNPSYSL